MDPICPFGSLSILETQGDHCGLVALKSRSGKLSDNNQGREKRRIRNLSVQQTRDKEKRNIRYIISIIIIIQVSTEFNKVL